jgi:hypothetical protein
MAIGEYGGRIAALPENFEHDLSLHTLIGEDTPS